LFRAIKVPLARAGQRRIGNAQPPASARPYNVAMQTPHVYCPHLQTGQVVLDDTEARHALRSRRLRSGDMLTLFDGRGRFARATIQASGSPKAAPPPTSSDRRHLRQATVTVETIETQPAPARTLTLIVAGCKGPRLNWLIEKCTELGVTRIVLARFARSIVRIGEHRRQKLRRTAIEACKQSGRLWLPEIEVAPQLKAAVAGAADHALLVAHPDEDAVPIGVWLQQNPTATRALAAVIGPEGGFTVDELALLRAAGAQVVRLGDHTLRVETAAIAVAASLAAC
jgi:16S rRNA (uracil1498-N3)-methyltransferase